MLAVGARRMLKADVGNKLDLLGDPVPMAASTPWYAVTNDDAGNRTAVLEAIVQPSPSFVEDT